MLILSSGVAAALAATPALKAVERGASGLTYTAPSANKTLAKAAGDTLYLLGGPDRNDGKFQNDFDPLIPDDEGWVPLGQFVDGTGPYWKVSTFNAELLDLTTPNNHAIWCGNYYLPCDGEPENPGYDNNILAILEWAESVPDPQLATQVHLSANLNHDSEPSYDYLFLEVRLDSGWAELASWDGNNKTGGIFAPLDLVYDFTVQPADYAGDLGDQILLRWRFQSDPGWSDADCLFQGDGAAQIDNITVSFDQGGGPQQMTFDDFEPGNPISWTPSTELISLAKVWPDLQDVGLCSPNQTPKLAFIDDGSASFSDGSWGTDWTYGPAGQVVYCPGFSSTSYVDQFWSPAIDLPVNFAEYDGAQLAFDVYVHGTALGTPNLYWTIRTSPDGGTTWSAWRFHGVVYEQHGPEYRRYHFDITPLLLPDADKVQVALGILTFSNFTNCSFKTPAPYYDNVALKLFKRRGPEIYNNSFDTPTGLATAGFPTGGTLDPADPASHSVDLPSAFGNAIEAAIAVKRDGATLAGPPQLHWRLQANPLYDGYRTGLALNPILGDSVRAPIPSDDRGGTRYAFEFPTEGFFFPGDVLHYYIRAKDNAPSGTGVAIFPADTTGYAMFPGMAHYQPGVFPQDFEARALPTLLDQVPGTQPPILFWLQNAGTLELDLWLDSWARLGFQHGVDFDLFKAPWYTSPGATAEQLAGYDIIVLASGKNATGSYLSEDIIAIDTWLAQGGKKLLFCGDNAVDYLLRFQQDFILHTLGIYIYPPFDLGNVRPEIGDQEAPGVLALPGNPVGLLTDFIANGSCYYNLFDAFMLYGTGQAILEWAAPDWTSGGYAPVAGVYNHLTAYDSHVVTLPYDLAFVGDIPVNVPDKALPLRALLLNEILTFFGAPGDPSPASVPVLTQLTVTPFPNPFNPQVQIAYNLPAKGPLAVRIFNVRGELVRMLYDEMTPAGRGTLVWDGTGADNRPSPSGVYFCEVKALQQRVVRKMALVR